jgi:uncharacterized repeat protein (TIGR03803 family)
MLAKNRTPGRRFSRRLVAALMVVAVSLLLTSIFASSAWAQAKCKTLHRFGVTGGFPYAGVTFDSAGNLYGTTIYGGSGRYGTVFELTPHKDGTWTESVLHSFNFTDGGNPSAGVIFDSAGNLYGTTGVGGAHSGGTVFELTPHKNGSWTESILYSFENGVPYAGVIFDSAGNLYGTTLDGGTAGRGTAFELTPHKDGTWTESILHSFNDFGNDGGLPEGGLVFDSLGNLYGTTLTGGANGSDLGTVFELTPHKDGTWTESILHSFKGSDGVWPEAGLTFDSVGNLYGTTARGGAYERGTVFELIPNPDGSWRESVLHSFRSGDGRAPAAGLIFDSSGNLYSTTYSGGAHNRGTVFSLTPHQDNNWTESVVYSFRDRPGAFPYSGLIFDKRGRLYGTTHGDGRRTFGTVFEIAP